MGLTEEAMLPVSTLEGAEAELAQLGQGAVGPCLIIVPGRKGRPCLI